MEQIITPALQNRIKILEKTPLRWWAGEAEVVRTYFSRPRTRNDDLFWLKLQAARELGTVERLLHPLQHQLAQIEKELSRSEFETALRSVYEEARHYRLFADIIEQIAGEKPDAQELLDYSGTMRETKGHPDLPALTAEVEITVDLRNRHGALADIALGFFEGAGAAMFYAGSQLMEYEYSSYSGGKIEKEIAEAMAIVFQDEMRHGPVHIPRVAQAIQSDEEMATAINILETKSIAHLRLRNETFGNPLSDHRMKEIDAGIDVIPLPVNYTGLTPMSPHLA